MRSKKMLKIGEWHVDPSTCTLHQCDASVHVTPRCMDVLMYLAAQPGQVVATQELLDRFWPSKAASDHAVHKVLASLRQALQDHPHEPRYLKTFPKRGYALIAPVTRTDTPDLPADPQDPTQADAPTLRRFRSAPVPLRLSGVAVALACILALIGATIAALRMDRAPVSDTQTTIALVPHLGSASDLDYLHSGLENALLVNLSRLQNLEVLSTALLERPEAAPLELARALKSDYVLTTALEPVGTQTYLTVNLASTLDATLVLADRFPLTPGDLLQRQDDLVNEIVSALRIYLDADQRRAMLDWGTASAAAYDHFIKAEFFTHQFNHADWELALEHYQAAIDIDPHFVNAYSGMATAANYMAVYSRQDRLARLKALLDDYGRRLEVTVPGHPVVNTLRTMALNVDGVNQPQLERIYRAQILEGNAPGYVYAQYGLFLVGARLYDEAARFLTLAEVKEPFVTSPNQGENFRSAILPPWDSIDVKKHQLFAQPAHLGILGTVISHLALMGRFEEAEYYLAQQEAKDLDGIRAHLSRILIGAASGELYRANSVRDQGRGEGGEAAPVTGPYRELFDPATLADPDLQFNNGVLAFLLGDIPAAIQHWRQLSFPDQRKLFTRLHAVEPFFPRSTVTDPRYVALLESLGVGRSWQHQLMQGVREMAPVTGIDLHPQSAAAWDAGEFMAFNNGWTADDWARLDAVRQERIAEIQALLTSRD